MKVILTIQLREDNDTVRLTGSQTKNNFVGNDYDLVRSFLVGAPLSNFVKLMGWIADGTIIYGSTQTVTINTL